MVSAKELIWGCWGGIIGVITLSNAISGRTATEIFLVGGICLTTTTEGCGVDM